MSKSKIKKYLKFSAKTLKETLTDTDLSTLASSLSYTTVFSLVPMLIIFFVISKSLGDYQGILSSFKTFVIQWVTTGLNQEIALELEKNLQGIELNTVGWFGFFGFIFSASRIMYDFEKSLLKIWAKKKSNLFAKHFPIYFAILVGLPLGLIALAAALEWSYLSTFLKFKTSTNTLLFFFIVVIMKWTPPQRVPWPVALPVSILTVLLMVATKELYLIAVKNLFQYNHYYGPIAMIPVFLIWIYLTWLLILFGLSLTRAVLQQKKT